MKLYKFETKTCNPCKTVSMILNNLNIPFQTIDIDDEENEELVRKYDIMSVPTLILLDDNGEVVEQIINLNHSEIEGLVKYFN